MKHYVSKSIWLKSWSTSSSSPKEFFEKVVLKLLLFSGESLQWSVIFVNRHANGQWFFSFCNSVQVFSFLASSVIFWAAVFQSTFERLLLEQHFSFRELMIRPSGLLQVPSPLNDNSLLKTFLQWSTIWLYTIIISLYFCAVNFFIWSLHFVYGKNNQPTNQTNINRKQGKHWG